MGNDFIRFDYGSCRNNKCFEKSYDSSSKDPREAAIARYQARVNQELLALIQGNPEEAFGALNKYSKEHNRDFFEKYQTLPANDEEMMSGIQRELPKADPNDATKPTFVTRSATPNSQKPAPVGQDAPAPVPTSEPVAQDAPSPTPTPATVAQEAPKEAPVPTPTPVVQEAPKPAEAPKPEAKPSTPAKSNVRAWALSAGTTIDHRKADVNPDVGVAHPGAKAPAPEPKPEPVAPPVEPTSEPEPAPVQEPQPAPEPEKPKGIDYQITAKDRAGLSKIVAEQYVDEQGNAINLGDKAGRKESLHLALAVAKDEQNKPIAEQSKGFHDPKKYGYDTSADHIKENQTVHLAQEIEVNGKKYHLKQPPAETKPAAEPAANTSSPEAVAAGNTAYQNQQDAVALERGSSRNVHPENAGGPPPDAGASAAAVAEKNAREDKMNQPSIS